MAPDKVIKAYGACRYWRAALINGHGTAGRFQAAWCMLRLEIQSHEIASRSVGPFTSATLPALGYGAKAHP